MKFLIIGYYTLDTFYEKEAKKFITSLKKFDIPYHVEGMANLGSWYKNTCYKPTFIKEKMKQFPDCNIIYVDVDAEFFAYPKLFEEIDENISVHLFDRSQHNRKCQGFEILSGTIFLQNNEKTYRLVERWETECKKRPNVWDQKSLEKVMEDYFPLPPEYCTIFDVMDHVKNPVIVHYQASRRVRKNKMLLKGVE